MKIFKENRYITSLLEFNNILKKHNKISLTMISFESHYLNAWKSTIEEAKLGFKLFLLNKNDEKLIFHINADERLLLLFQEVKWLHRLRIEIPNSVKDLLAQVYISKKKTKIIYLSLANNFFLNFIKEKKFKLFKSNLDLLVSEYKRVVSSIPTHIFSLFRPHIKQTLDLCNPGCFILTWNSLNIGITFYSLLIALNDKYLSVFFLILFKILS